MFAIGIVSIFVGCIIIFINFIGFYSGFLYVAMFFIFSGIIYISFGKLIRVLEEISLFLELNLKKQKVIDNKNEAITQKIYKASIVNSKKDYSKNTDFENIPRFLGEDDKTYWKRVAETAEIKL